MILWGERKSFDRERTYDGNDATAATEYAVMATRNRTAGPQSSAFIVGYILRKWL
jgi:hypothetical protein